MKELLLPQLPGGVVGNSRMLASVLGNGELYRLFWPHIDSKQHIGRFWVGLRETDHHGSPTLWLHDHSWLAKQSYYPETNILVTDLNSEHSSLKVRQTDFVLPLTDILVRRYNISNNSGHASKLTLVVYCSFLIDESELYDTMYVNFEQKALIQFRRDTYIGFTVPGYSLAGYQCGRRDTSSDPRQAVEHGEFWGSDSNLRGGAGAIGWHLGVVGPGEIKDIALYLGIGNGESELIRLLNEAAAEPPGLREENTAHFWQGWLRQGHHYECSTGEEMYARSLLAMKLMSDRQTGASIAAPEFDPYYTQCGGYGYCWPRDGMYVALAFDEAGFHTEARDFYRFASRVQNVDGSWHQRYFMDGSQAPTWGQQIDQVGAVLWGYRHHYELTEDPGFLDEIWPSLELGANYLLSNLLPENSLPRSGYDQWEELFAQGTYTSAAVYGGLHGASRLARLRGDLQLAQKWEITAEQIKSSIAANQWDPSLQRFIRGINKKVAHWDFNQAREQGMHAWTDTDPSGLYTTHWVARDHRLDSALLGLVYPFEVFSPDNPVVVSTVEAMEIELTNHTVGGIHRYNGDHYAGGNPWTLITLWLSIYYSIAGKRDKALPLYQWAIRNANPAGLLPEQVNKDHGGPAWVVPLNWSHAMFVLAHLALQGKLRGFSK